MSEVNIEELTTSLLDAKTTISEMKEMLEGLTETNKAQQKRIASLEESNQKLFLKATQHIEPEKKEITEEEFQSKLMNADDLKMLSPEQQQKLKEMEGEIEYGHTY